VFGGQDASGNYLNEVWLLRAYNGVISHSDQHWSGYGNGNLQTGVNANGQGVTVSYMSNCASFIGKNPPTTSTPSTSSAQPSSPTGVPSTSSVPGSNNLQAFNPYDTSTTHKILAPVSIAVALPAILLYRLSTAPSNAIGKPGLMFLAGSLASSAFAIGIAGLTTAFTSIVYAPTLAKRSSVPTLPTSHSRASVALFIAFYLLSVAVLCMAIWQRWRSRETPNSGIKRTRTLSNDLAEKAGLYQNRAASPGPPDQTAPALLRPRSGDYLNAWPFFGFGHAGRQSTESGTTRDDHTPSPSAHSFEVVNRPARARHASAHSLAAFSDPRSTSTSPHNLADMSWSFPPRSASRLVCFEPANPHKSS
jgi:hypothetical protein